MLLLAAEQEFKPAAASSGRWDTDTSERSRLASLCACAARSGGAAPRLQHAAVPDVAYLSSIRMSIGAQEQAEAGTRRLRRCATLLRCSLTLLQACHLSPVYMQAHCRF